MNSNSKSRMPMLVGVGLALAAILLLLPAHGHAATLNVTDDSYVNDNNTSKNFGKKKVVKVDGTKDLTGFAKFDLSVLGGAVGADIDTATLRIFVSKVKASGSINIHQVTEKDWSEGTINAGNAPTFGGTLGAVGAGVKNTFVLLDEVDFDVTDLVKAWLDFENGTGGTENFGIAILPTDGSDIYIELDSKESGRNQVELEVSNVPPAPPAPIGTVGGPMGGQLIGGGTSPATLNTSGTKFVGMFHGQPEADSKTIGVPMPGDGSVTDLHVHLDFYPGGGT